MKKILLIDDESTFRDTMGTLLRRHGYEVMNASDGLAGVKMARNNRPDLVISDVVMEPVDGFMTLSILRQQPDTARIPFVLVTGQEALEGARKGMVLGADDYLSKPFTADDLLGTVKTLLERRKEALIAAAEQVKRLKELLFSPLPDQLTQSLGNISGGAAQITASPAPDGEQGFKEHGSRIFSAALQLKNDIRHALILAQLEVISGQPDAKEVLRESEACELSEMVASEASRHARLNQRENNLLTSLEAVRVSMGSQPLAKVLEEVMANAFSCSVPNSPVKIATTRSDNDVLLSIETQVVHRVPRTVGDPNETVLMSKESGDNPETGMAMQVARRLVEVHGGKMNVIQRGHQSVAVHINLPVPKPATNLN